MANTLRLKRFFAGVIAPLCVVLLFWDCRTAAAQNQESRTVGGLTIYLSVVPTENVKGPSPHSAERPMHGRIPRGVHEHHVVATIFDAAGGTRVSDAAVTAQVSGLGLSGRKKKLEAMEIAGATTYSEYFNLPGHDLYTVRLTIERRGGARPVVVDFKYDYRR